MDETITGVTSDSPPDALPTDAAPSAGTTNTDLAAPDRGPVPYERFQEVNQRYREFEALSQQQQQALTQLQEQVRRMQEAARPADQPPSREYVDAAEALMKIMAAHPKLKPLLGIADAAPQLMQGYQGVQELTQQQFLGLVRSGRQQIAQLAKESQLALESDDLRDVEELVTAVIRRTPGADARFRQGDLTVVEEAFKAVSGGFVARLRRQSAAATASSKASLRTLPPAPRGGSLPGPAVPVKPEPGKERAFTAQLHETAARLLAERTG